MSDIKITFKGPRGPRLHIIPALSVEEVMEDEKPEVDDRPSWVQEATDEHARAFDPADVIPMWEYVWMLRELESSDMNDPDEFLRRSA